MIHRDKPIWHWGGTSGEFTTCPAYNDAAFQRGDYSTDRTRRVTCLTCKASKSFKKASKKDSP